MTLHCDVAISPQWWRLYFTTVIECLRGLMKDFRSVGLLASLGDLEVWKDHYLEELGGQRVLHAPLGASIDSFLQQIQQIFQEKLKVEPVPFSVRKIVPVYLHLEGTLLLQLPDGDKHEVPFDVVITHRTRKKYHGDIYLRTFTYYGHEFIDFFQGTESHAMENRTLLVKALKRFVEHASKVRRIIIGLDVDAYDDLTRVVLFYSRSEERLIEDLLETATTLKRNLKEGHPLPKPLNVMDLDVISDRTRPVNKTYLLRRIIKHPFYRVDVPLYYNEYHVIRQEGSILIYQQNFKPMTEVHAKILKDISLALQKALKPREVFDRDLIEGFNEIHEKRKKSGTHEEPGQQHPFHEEELDASATSENEPSSIREKKERLTYWLNLVSNE